MAGSGVLAAVARVEILPSFAGFAAASGLGLRNAGAGLETEARALGGRMGRAMSLGMGTLVGVAGIGAALGDAVKQATAFQAQMTRVSTQAGASAADVTKLSKAVLGMGDTGQSAQNLAVALYHVKSAGFNTAQSLDIVRAAAKGATIGHADLEAVTQAMIATMASGIPGVHGAADAIAILNKTVGIGDMTMSQLASSMATGILPAARSAGLSMNDVAAAMATVTDNATPASETATRLRMTFALMSAPTSAAQKALKTIGLSGSDLANDMRKPQGLLVAVQDLKKHMEAAGLSAVQQNQLIVRAFGGGRSSGTIMTLVEESDRLGKKYHDLGTAAKRAADLQAAWQATTQTFSYKMSAFRASMQNVAIEVGQKLLPVLGKFADWMTAHAVPVIENKLIPAVSRFVKNEGPTFKQIFLDTVAALKQAAQWIGATWDAIRKFIPEDQRKRILELIVALIALKKVGLLSVGFRLAGAGLNTATAIAKLAAGGSAGVAGEGAAAFRGAGSLVLPAAVGFAAGEGSNYLVDRFGPKGVGRTGKAFEKVGAGAASGALVGAGVGTLIGGPGVGTAIGAGLGALGGGVAGYIADPKAVNDSIRNLLHKTFGSAPPPSAAARELVNTDAWALAGRQVSEAMTTRTAERLQADRSATGDQRRKAWKDVETATKAADAAQAKYDRDAKALKPPLSPWQKFTKAFTDDFAKPVGHWFTTDVPKLWDEIAKPVTKTFNSVKHAITAGFDGWWKTHGKEVQEVWRATWAFAQRYFHDSIMPMVKVGKAAFDLLIDVFKTGWDVVKGVFKVAWIGLKTAVKIGFEGIKDAIKFIWDTIVGIFSIALDLITGHWGQAWKDLKTMLGQQWNAIKDFIINGLTDLGEGAEGIVKSIFGSLGGLVNDIIKIFVDGINLLIATANVAIKGIDLVIPGKGIPTIPSIPEPGKKSAPTTTSEPLAAHRRMGGDPTARALGGPVVAGMPYIVGERNPELFVPGSNGRILPHVPNRLGGGAQVINVTVHNPVPERASESVPRRLRQLTYQMGG